MCGKNVMSGALAAVLLPSGVVVQGKLLLYEPFGYRGR